jgi:acyl-CoA hydrolase
VIRTGEPEEAIDALLARVGRRIGCATPLGLGKPAPLLNALYARAKGDAQLQLSIFTALSLEVPRAAGDLERRFLEPFAKRMFEGVPPLDYLRDLRAGGFPANVALNEFYFRPGAMLGVPAAQQGYISSNYTHAARDMLARGVNAVLIMVGERDGRYSLSCNPDLTLDVVAGMRARSSPAHAPCAVLGMVNRNLPFMTGDAEVGEEYFDVLLDAPRWEHRLFGAPNPAADPADHAIGLHAAALVKDGGTLQLGIGSLGDSVAHWLRLRQERPEALPAAAAALGLDRYRELIEREGGLGRFAEGLFGSSEMFTWGLMSLYRAGVIRRRDDKGHVMQAAFFLGPEAFYEALRALPEDERRLFRMTSVARINDFFGEEEVVRRRLRDARFINICLKATLFGAVASDGLEDGRVVSGVGGQYNFVAMAHELAGARSILLLRSTREAGGETESNIVFNYGHATIPRHLRDIVVTEYGIADLRGRTDAEVAGALIAIADRRFQDALAARAIAASKLPRGWRVPEAALGNTPQALADRLAPLGRQGLLPMFPLGTDFDAAEQQLVPALRWLKESASHWRGRAAIAMGLATAQASTRDALALHRMGLDAPRGLRERLLRRLVVLSLQRTIS